MSRRPPPTDHFTRFTSTSPHASSKQPASFSYQAPTPRSTLSSSPPSPFNAAGAGPNGETPREKVARLRLAAQAAKAQNNMSLVDRMIYRGRIWADISHRIVTYGLIGFTGISTIIAVFGLSSLITHNRRQKRAWIEREMQRLSDAQQAFLKGEATPEQLHLLEQERAGEKIAQKAQETKRRKKEESLWGKVKGLMPGFSRGDMGKEKETVMAEEASSDTGAGGVRLLEEGWVDPSEMASRRVGGGGVMQAVNESRREGEKELVTRTGSTGGSLDVLADNFVGALTSRSDSGWMSWVRGGGKS